MDGSKASQPWRHLPGRTARRWEEEGAHSPLIALKSQNERLDATCVRAYVSSSASDSPQLPKQNYVPAETCEEHWILVWVGYVARETRCGNANFLNEKCSGQNSSRQENFYLSIYYYFFKKFNRALRIYRTANTATVRRWKVNWISDSLANASQCYLVQKWPAYLIFLTICVNSNNQY